MINNELLFFMNLTKVQTIVARKFDALSVHGLNFSDFMILYVLANSTNQKLRRIDLAEKIGLTASGVTRLLTPLEKIGLVSRETNARDARVSYVVITNTGKQIFEEALITANSISDELLNKQKGKNLQQILTLLFDLGGTFKK